MCDYEKCLDMKKYQEKSCKWSLGSTEPSPHMCMRQEKKPIYNNILEAIGNTPMVRLNNITKKENIQCEVLVKCEFLNPGGSTKDRIAHRMIQEAEKLGKIKPGDTLIEATSGNTGIGIAMVGASKGYKVLITLPEKMSQEKCDTLKGLGAEIIRTPTEAPCDSVDSHIGIAIKKNKEIKDSLIPDQYVNTGNSLAHYDGTAEEIWEQCEGKLDYVVISAGTGGTMTGIGRKLKEKNPNIQIIGVDPEGSLLAIPENLNDKGRNESYKVEGIGYDFIPKNCDQNIADTWLKSNDKDSFYWARRLIAEEGLLVGGSSGATLSGAMQIAKSLPSDKRVVVVCVDSIRNYITKFLNDDWMVENGFYEQDVLDKDLKAYGEDQKIEKHSEKFPYAEPVSENITLSDALRKMNTSKIRCLPVLNSKDVLVGIITKRRIISSMLNYTLTKDDIIKKIIIKDFKKLSPHQPMKYLSKAFLRHEYVVIDDPQSKIFKIVEADDMLNVHV